MSLGIKFMPADDNTINFFDTHQMLFSKVFIFNDALEMYIGSSSSDNHTYREIITGDSENAALVFCCSRIDNIKYSAKDGNELMWAHYTNCHQGFAVIFNRDNAFNNLKTDTLTEICKEGEINSCPDGFDIQYTAEIKPDTKIKQSYSHIKEDGTSGRNEEHQKNSIKNYQDIFKKNKDWEYEKEYRYIVLNRSSYAKSLHNDNNRFLIKMNSDAIKGIVLGNRFIHQNNSRMFLKK